VELERETPITILEEEILDTRLIDWEAAWRAYDAVNYEPSSSGVPQSIEYMFKRGFSYETLNEWEFGLDPITGMVCFPYRNVDGQLIGLKGREWRRDAIPRYKVLGDKGGANLFGFPTLDVGRALFGIDKVPDVSPVIVLTEGELNAVACHQVGLIPVGVSGRWVSSHQASLVMSITDHVVLLFDDLSDALAASRMFQGKIGVSVVDDHLKDPADSEPDEIRSIVANAKSPLEFRLDRDKIPQNVVESEEGD
jgi:DNA primase